MATSQKGPAEIEVSQAATPAISSLSPTTWLSDMASPRRILLAASAPFTARHCSGTLRYIIYVPRAIENYLGALVKTLTVFGEIL